MGEPTLNLNAPPSALAPNLDGYFATPAIWLPGMDEAEWQAEIHKMVARSRLAHAFVTGEISPDDFMDGLHEHGVDVIAASDDWENGIVYL
jgi:hypothetical protein